MKLAIRLPLHRHLPRHRTLLLVVVRLLSVILIRLVVLEGMRPSLVLVTSPRSSLWWVCCMGHHERSTLRDCTVAVVIRSSTFGGVFTELPH